MLHPSTKMLIDKLSEMTRKQRVAWDEGENGQIIHDTEGYRVILTAAPHTVMLTDVLGKEIETCTPDEIAAEADIDGRPYAQFVAELYREAGRHARGTERAIDAVLRGLDRDAEDDTDEAAADFEQDAPTIQLDEAESIEDLTDESDPGDFESLAIDEDLPALDTEAIEGETEMTRAIEAMAEEVNGHEPEAVELTAPETVATDIPSFERVVELPETDAEPETPVFEAEAPEPVTEWASEDTSQPEQIAEPDVPPLYAEPEADVQTPPAAPTNRVSTAGGSGFFGSSLGDLSRYRSQQVSDKIAEEIKAPTPDTETTETTDLAATVDVEDVQPEIAASIPEAVETSSIDSDLPPTVDETVDAKPEARKFSLSGLTSGFGMGVPAAVTPAEPPAPAVETSPQPPKMIDGTIDLPDHPPSEPTFEAEASPVLPSFDQPLTQPTEETADKEWIVRDETPEPEPQKAEAEPEKAEPVLKKPTPFNPWN